MGDRYFTQKTAEFEEFLNFIDEDLENIRRVMRRCSENGIDPKFIVHGKAETAEESAENTGIDPGNIVKTLVFIAGDEPVAVLCPGDCRVDESKIEDLTGEEVRMANPEEVKDATGYTVGGVSPFDLDIPVYIESSVMNQDEVKPAAGSRVVGLKINPSELEQVTGAEQADVTE